MFINQNESEFNLQLGNNDLLTNYKDIKSNIERLVLNYPIAKDTNFDLKIKFAEIMHFSSLMWFHLKYDQKENRALCLYLQAIRLADDLLKELGVSCE
ncbi:TPA: hypothetical protein SBX19_000461 [Campylobacter coli]|nr:hypothetical protein [Campylobacter coli]